jgi:hypothetical protein
MLNFEINVFCFAYILNEQEKQNGCDMRKNESKMEWKMCYKNMLLWPIFPGKGEFPISILPIITKEW